jgi:hypothetical protein
MSLHSVTLSWFWAYQSLLFLINAACFAKKHQISIVVFGLTDQGSNPGSTELDMSMLDITPQRWFILFEDNLNRICINK